MKMIALTSWNIEAIRQKKTRTKALVPVNGEPCRYRQIRVILNPLLS